MRREMILDSEQRSRLAKACQTLGITFEEFVKEATLQALDEFDGTRREVLDGP